MFVGRYVAAGRGGVWPRMVELVRAAFGEALRRGAGDFIVYGTDAGGYAWSENQAQEFPMMVQYGMTPMQAIRSATGNWLNKWVSKVTHPFDAHIKERPFHTIFFSKFAYGFHHAILLRAGSLKIPYPNLLRADIIATFVWMIIVGGLGYASGTWLHQGEQYLHYAGYVMVAAIVIFITIEQIIVRQTKKRL